MVFSSVGRSVLERSGHRSFGLESDPIGVSKPCNTRYCANILKCGIEEVPPHPFSQRPHLPPPPPTALLGSECRFPIPTPNSSSSRTSLKRRSLWPSLPCQQIKTGQFIECELYCGLDYVRQCGEGTAEVTQTAKHGKK